MLMLSWISFLQMILDFSFSDVDLEAEIWTVLEYLVHDDLEVCDIFS